MNRFLSLAGLARDEEVGNELHLNALVAEARAGGATAITAVEGEVAGAHACGLCGVELGEELANLVPCFAEECRI